MQVSSSQAEAIACINQSSCIVALPGAGKTRTLIAKAKAMLEAGLSGIVMLSYTAASAKEMQERLSNELQGFDVVSAITVSTFHALLLRHIQQSGVTLLDPQTEQTIWYDVFIQHGAPAKMFDRFMMFMKGQGNFNENDTDEFTLIKTQIEERIINTVDKVTLNNTISKSLAMIKQGKLPLLDCRYLFVDEFQDADREQLEFVCVHGLSGVVVTVVGDDDQSIYGFRQAQGVKAFHTITKLLQAKQFILNTNYRSHIEILTPSFALIEHNVKRIAKQPISHRATGGHTHLLQYDTTADEAWGVARIIQASPTVNTFIIARNNKYLDTMETVLTECGIAFTRNGGTKYFDTPVCQFALSALKAFSEQNKTHLAMVWSIIFPELTTAQVNAFIASSTFSGHALREYQQTALRNLNYATQALRGGHTDKAIEYFLLGLHGPMMIHGFTKVDLLKSLSNHLLGIKASGITEKIIGLLQTESNEQANVRLMTMHSSKGLECERVFVVGFAHKIIPSLRSDDVGNANDKLEEERRLAFVAMTRAEDELYVTYPLGTDKQPKRHGPSPFISEAGLL